MRKFLSIISAFFMSALVAVSSFSSVIASADDVSNVKIDCKAAIETNTWGKSLSIPVDKFAIGRITADTQFVVTYEITDKTKFEDLKSCPVGLALQSFDDPENALADDKGAVWAEVTPTQYDETSATFYYQDIVKAYTSKDFSHIEYIHVIAPSAVTMKCTGLTITDCLDKVPETTTTTTTKAEDAADEKETEATTQATTTTQAAVQNTESSKGTSPILLIVGVVAGVAIAVVIIIIIMNRKSREAFDVSTGKFVDKKKLFDANDTENKDDKK